MKELSRQNSVSTIFTSHELFSLSKLLTVGRESKTNAKKPVEIKIVAVGGYVGNAFLALALSNDCLIFRYVGESGIPLVHRLKWYRESSKKIVAMDFDPSAQWLLCATSDGSVYLLPIYFLMCRKDLDAKSEPQEKEKNSSNWASKFNLTKKKTFNNATRKFGILNDINTISTNTKSKYTVTCCLWWKTFSGTDYAILGTKEGAISFLNFETKEDLVLIKLKHNIMKMELVSSPNKTSKYLLTVSYTHLTLPTT
eukprot:TRINITY_DN2449_c0_g1_i3.p1 TRINITY_DN2449_c0_g1~~TRINITY_DN2449_c0_g1_i3.p1  ORF type:complete len:278 (+),score=65.97 TRINITY_DN2449_c0_g1_i3:75-836(+)